MKVGIPKETAAGETRVAGTPETVKKLAAQGLEVLVESGAGASAHYTDQAYQQAGARLTDAAGALGADLVLKVRKPSAKEAAAFSAGAVLLCLLEPCVDDGTLKRLAERRVDALAMELIPRISRAQSMDVLSSQANIAGYRAVLEGAARYGRFFPMMMTAAGAARPAKVAVLGAGVAGLQAIATARRLGAEVSSFDVRPEVREQIESLGAKFIDLDIGESGAGTGGYAKELSEEAKRRQQEQLTEYLKGVHVIVSTALIPCRPAPVLITEEAVKGMAPGSVVVDMAAASGGNCPLTEADKVVVKHDVTLVGHTNYPAMVPGDASAFYARNLLNLLGLMLEGAPENPALKDFAADEVTDAAAVTKGGEIVYPKS